MKKTATTLILFNLFLTVFSQNIVLMDESHNIVSNTTIDINMDTSAKDYAGEKGLLEIEIIMRQWKTYK